MKDGEIQTMKSRVTRFLLTTTVLCAAFFAARGALADSLLGDADGDGAVTAADAAAVLRVSEGRTEQNSIVAAASDVTGNNKIDATDAKAMLFAVTGRIPSLAEFAERVSAGLCDEALFDRFCYTGARWDGDSYYSDAVSVTVTTVETSLGKNLPVAYVLADIYVQDVTCFRTALSSGAYHSERQYTKVIAAENNAIVAISGDFYDFSKRRGLVVRNGIWYRQTLGVNEDIMAMYYDGTMETVRAQDIDVDALREKMPYQIWSFGPALLTEDGGIPERYNSKLKARNPRSSMGYYEPGHYCFILVDGRKADYSVGLSLPELSELFQSLGCKAAYNLDGGGTAVMANLDGVLSKPSGKGRPVSDIVYVGEPVEMPLTQAPEESADPSNEPVQQTPVP